MSARKLTIPAVVPAWLPPAADKVVVLALKALHSGTAADWEQKLALAWIVTRAADADGQSYRPGADGDRETAFAEGRRFVGTHIRRLVNMPSEKVEQLP